MAFDRDPKFYSELKQINGDILKLIETFHSKSPYYDYTDTFQDYAKQLSELKDKYPICSNIDSNNSNGNQVSSTDQTGATDQNEPRCEPASVDAENEDPPQPNLDIFRETGAKFEARCKLYLINRSEDKGTTSNQLLGCGTLFVKDIDSTKLHLIMRQDPDLRKVLFNHVITTATPKKLLTKAVQLGIPEGGKVNIYLAKVKDDNVASKLYSVLHSFGSDFQ